MKGAPPATKFVGLKIGLGVVALAAAGVFLYMQLAGGTPPGMPEPGSGTFSSGGGDAKPSEVKTVKDGDKPQSGQGAQTPAAAPPKPNPYNGGNRVIPKEQVGNGGGGGG